MPHAAWVVPLAVALGLRLWQHDLTPFLDDEAVLLTAASRMLDTKRLALEAGLALSIHVNEPPLVLYLDAIPMLISRNPAWVSACLTALDGLASVLIYKATERLAGRFAGFGAALLFAVAPAAIYYSRRIYYSELVPLCTAIFLLALVQVWQRRSSVGLAVALVAAACATELHASAAPLLAVWLAVAILSRRWMKDWRPLAIGAGVVALTLAPYLYLQITTGWPDALGIWRFLREPRVLDASALDAAVTVIGGGIYRHLLLPYPEPGPPFDLDAAGWLLVALVVAGAVLAVKRRTPMHLTLLALLVLPVLASLRHTVGVLPYYLLPALAPAVVLAGMAVGAVPWRLAGAALLAVPVIWQVGGYLNLQRVAAADGPKLNYGMPLRYELQAADMAGRVVPPGDRLSVSEVGNQATTFPYLTGYRYRLVESDSRYGVALTPGGTS
ncbi:MAG TPA: glycosyltransferase family 39 protein, partial [Chloroflexota bacterium]|nr:glycosyltransferase family 39 protein [Chloroflexota bacterium]